MNKYSSLNENQQKAIESEGCIIVIAGPGTGKTKTLTTRISYLIDEKKVKPSEILALTFTVKAAEEMRDRLSDIKKLPDIYTFHSLAFQFLKGFNDRVTIISDEERFEILELIQEKYKSKINKKTTRELALMITQYKNNSDLTDSQSIILEYNKMLRSREVMDYDDFLIQMYDQLSSNNNEQFRNKYSYILIDEFQDTNKLQYQIIKLLLKNNNLFVIGDPYQSIYSFRGAYGDIFELLKNDFPDHKIIRLETNYRSSKNIISASSALFPELEELQSISNTNKEVLLVKTINEYLEGEYIAEEINLQVGGTDLLKVSEISSDKNICFSDFAIIYRTHASGRLIQEKFKLSGIPYQVIGEGNIYEQTEIAFIILILQYIENKEYEFLQRIFASKLINLTRNSKKKLRNLFLTYQEKSIRILSSQKENFISDKKDIQKISTIINVIDQIVKYGKNKSIDEVIHIILQSEIMQDYLNGHRDSEMNINSFLSIITQFNSAKEPFQALLQYIDYLKNHEYYDPRCDKVTFLTMHASKGLEFKYVFICGFEDGIIPLQKNSIDPVEEKRLLYVAMTRAKEKLYVLHAKQRYKKESVISPFYNLIKNHITVISDPAIFKYQKKQKMMREKKSQLKLF